MRAQIKMRLQMRRVAVAVLAAACAFFATDRVWAAPGSVYDVAKISVDATAKDAVQAKEKALAKGRQDALHILLKRITPMDAQERLPHVKSDIVENMLSGFAVRSEAFSGTRYIATLDYQFHPSAVQQLLSGYGLPVTAEQAPELKLLPLYVLDGKVQTGARDVWRKAWVGLDLSHALTPIELLQPASIDVQTVQAALAGDPTAFQAFSRQYGGDRLVLAVAEPQQDGRLSTRLYGNDATGLIDLARSDRVFDNDLAGAADRAALVALGVFENRWKIRHSPGGADNEQVGGGMNVNVAVEFSSMRQWQDIYTRLGQVPGVQGLNVDALSARAATVTFQYAGGPDRLGQQLAQRGLTLDDQGGRWVLRSY